MKVVISENKVFDTIYNYLDKYFDINDINWDYGRDEDEYGDFEIENKNFLIFYKGEWSGEDYTDIVFNYFNKEYYDDSPGSWIEKAPILEVMYEYGEHLDTMFGNHWKEPMKKWFERFTNLPVNTVSTYYN